MRIWDLSPKLLCRSHLLGEHRELHAVWAVIVHNKKGYSRHPETLRWRGKLKALYLRHQKLVCEMTGRGYQHASALDRRYARGSARQCVFVNTPGSQRAILRRKGCGCRVRQESYAKQ